MNATGHADLITQNKISKVDIHLVGILQKSLWVSVSCEKHTGHAYEIR